MISENNKKVKELKEKVKNHCMCYQFTESKTDFMVYYPNGMVVDGIRIAHSVDGKIKTLEKLLTYMDKHWYESGIKLKPNSADNK